MGSTVTRSRVASALLDGPGRRFDVRCVPAADADFVAAVHEAVAAVDPAISDPAPGVELLLRARFPRASVVARDLIAGYSPDVTWYALREGRRPGDAPRRILIVDDDSELAGVIADELEEGQFEVRFATDGAAALALLATWTPSLILLDLMMPLMSGDDFAERYSRLPPPHAPLVVVSGAGDAASRAERMHARSVVSKPFDLEALTRLVDRYA